MSEDTSKMVGHVGSTGASTGPHLRLELPLGDSEMLNALANLKSDLDFTIAQRDGYQRRAEMLQKTVKRLQQGGQVSP